MKKILVFSDLHIPSRLKKFPYDKIIKYTKNIDYIFGLGDYDSMDGLNCLYGFGKEIFAVCGNMDDYSIKCTLSDQITLSIDKISIGLIHGWGSHYGIKEKILHRFNNDINLICYGHTHSAFFGKLNNVFFFNPGSICGENPSFGLIEISGKKIKAEIINC